MKNIKNFNFQKGFIQLQYIALAIILVSAAMIPLATKLSQTRVTTQQRARGLTGCREGTCVTLMEPSSGSPITIGTSYHITWHNGPDRDTYSCNSELPVNLYLCPEGDCSNTIGIGPRNITPEIYTDSLGNYCQYLWDTSSLIGIVHGTPLNYSMSPRSFKVMVVVNNAFSISENSFLINPSCLGICETGDTCPTGRVEIGRCGSDVCCQVPTQTPIPTNTSIPTVTQIPTPQPAETCVSGRCIHLIEPRTGSQITMGATFGIAWHNGQTINNFTCDPSNRVDIWLCPDGSCEFPILIRSSVVPEVVTSGNGTNCRYLWDTNSLIGRSFRSRAGGTGIFSYTLPIIFKIMILGANNASSTSGDSLINPSCSGVCGSGTTAITCPSGKVLDSTGSCGTNVCCRDSSNPAATATPTTNPSATATPTTNPNPAATTMPLPSTVIKKDGTTCYSSCVNCKAACGGTNCLRVFNSSDLERICGAGWGTSASPLYVCPASWTGLSAGPACGGVTTNPNPPTSGAATATPGIPAACNTCPTANPSKTRGNANCDTAINVDDLTLWYNQWFAGGTPSTASSADFNCDGTVDLSDLAMWLSNSF